MTLYNAEKQLAKIKEAISNMGYTPGLEPYTHLSANCNFITVNAVHTKTKKECQFMVAASKTLIDAFSIYKSI